MCLKWKPLPSTSPPPSTRLSTLNSAGPLCGPPVYIRRTLPNSPLPPKAPVFVVLGRDCCAYVYPPHVARAVRPLHRCSWLPAAPHSRPSNSQGIPQPATVTPVTTTTPATPANADLSLSPGFIAFLFPSSSWLALYGWVGCVYWGGLGEPAFWVTFGVPKHQRFAPKKREETSLRGDPLSLTPPPGSNL